MVLSASNFCYEHVKRQLISVLVVAADFYSGDFVGQINF